MSHISLIVGLGNPGAEYENTRHNAGEWFVSAISSQAKVKWRHETKFQGLHSIAHDCHLLIPQTFMNLSGQSVKALSHFYKIPPQSILVAHDEIDLPVGVVRLKYDGGDGGHNGLKDIIRHLGTRQFYRLRIGVGRPENSQDVVDYVLHPPKKAERQQIDQALEKVYPLLPTILAGHMQ